MWSVKVSGSTSTMIACTPLAVAPLGGPKYRVDSRPGSVPGCTAPRIGFAFIASSPSRMDLPGTPAIETLPSAMSMSSSAHSKCSDASRRIFPRTALAASFTALPATTAPRLAKVVRKRREVLVDDLVIVGERIGRNEIAPANFSMVDAKIAGREIKQPLHDKDAMLAPRAPIWGDDRLIGEHCRKSR